MKVYYICNVKVPSISIKLKYNLITLWGVLTFYGNTTAKIKSTY